MSPIAAPVGEGTRVVLNFSLSLEDGSEVDSNFGSDPVEFVIGDGNLLPGFERHLIGMTAGDRQIFTVMPEDAFGQINDSNVQLVPRKQFDEDTELEIGLLYSFSDASGGELPGMVISFDDRDVEVDFNHPLAGRTIMFDVLVHRVEPTELH
jgi:FKBP-type peptidyl-prolyl cis-trans isomerase SlpA